MPGSHLWVKFLRHKVEQGTIGREDWHPLCSPCRCSTGPSSACVHSKNPEINLLTHINRAAKERAFLESLLNDFEEVGGWLLQLIPFCNATSEVLEAFGCGATREGLIWSIQPAQNRRHNNQAPCFPLPSGEALSVPAVTAFLLSGALQQLQMCPSIQLCFLDLCTWKAQHKILYNHAYTLQVQSYQWQELWTLLEEKILYKNIKTKQFASLVPQYLNSFNTYGTDFQQI